MRVLNLAICASTESVGSFRMSMSCDSRRNSSSRVALPNCSWIELKIAAAEERLVRLTLCSFGIASMRKAFALTAVRGFGTNTDSGSEGGVR
jgi:hypothetical protein